LRLVPASTRAAILVEGWSDHAALETLAQRLRPRPARRAIVVLRSAGVTNITHSCRRWGGVSVCAGGLCDMAEVAVVIRGLKPRADGLDGLTRRRWSRWGFRLRSDPKANDPCRGGDGVSRSRSEGADSFRRFQAQPAQRGRARQAQLQPLLAHAQAEVATAAC
jgi:hypothetical protein